MLTIKNIIMISVGVMIGNFLYQVLPVVGKMNWMQAVEHSFFQFFLMVVVVVGAFVPPIVWFLKIQGVKPETE